MANQIIVTDSGNVQVAIQPTPNVQVQISRAVIGTVANVTSANYANFAGTVVNANQPNITTIGTLGNLTVSNTITTKDLSVTGNLSAGNLIANTANYANFAGVAYSINGSNVSGPVANANYATISGTSYAVSGANVSGQVSYAAVANSVAGSNVTGTVANATYAVTAGTANSVAGANVSGEVNYAQVANSVSVGNVSGIGNIATVNLTGSSSNVLYGNGVFAPAAGGGDANYANFAGTAFSVSGSNVSGEVANATYATNAGQATVANSANTVAGANVTGTVANATYAITAGTSNALNAAVANVHITGGSANYILQTDGAGNLSWTAVVAPISVANANYSNFAGTAYSVSGSNVSGEVANANYASYAGNVTVSSQPNITSVGTLTSLAVAGNITGPDVIAFDTANGTGTLTAGQLSWTNTEATMNLGMLNGVVQQIGLENYIYVKASSAITDGQVVMFTGASGDNVLGAPADVTSVGFQSEYVIGVATQNIATNNFGYITVFGQVHGLNTNAFNVGDILWLDTTTPGLLTNVQPTDPNYQIQVAAVTKKSGGDGHIQVRVTPFASLTRLTDVNITTPTTGEALVYNGSNVWINGNPNVANYAAVANSVALANVVGIGNIASINLDGNVSNALLGNGSWGPVEVTSTSISNGTSNVSIPVSNGPVNFSVGGNANIANIDGNASLFLMPKQGGFNNALRIDNYGRTGNVNASRITSLRYRGNSTAQTGVQPGDGLMEFFTAAHNGAALQTNSASYIKAVVDASYTANGANIPIGWQFIVNDTNGGTNNQQKTHNFYSNGNVIFANYATATGFFGDGGNLSNIQGSNVSGEVAYAAVANSVAVANVSGIGNIATINLDGSSSNVLYGNGVWAPSAGGGGTPGGSNTQLQFNDNGTFGGISTVTYDGSKLSLGAVSNVIITGGTANYVLQTDGTGNLSWVAQSGGGSTTVDYTPSFLLGGM